MPPTPRRRHRPGGRVARVAAARAVERGRRLLRRWTRSCAPAASQVHSCTMPASPRFVSITASTSCSRPIATSAVRPCRATRSSECRVDHAPRAGASEHCDGLPYDVDPPTSIRRRRSRVDRNRRCAHQRRAPRADHRPAPECQLDIGAAGPYRRSRVTGQRGIHRASTTENARWRIARRLASRWPCS